MNSTTPPDPLATTPEELAEFTRLMTGGRMNSYQQAVQAGASASDALEIYSYNMAVAAASLGPLHILEVTARNAIHYQLVKHTGRDDWWQSGSISLVAGQDSKIEDAEDKVLRSLGSSRRMTPDDVVAALSFGFWCGLLGRGDARQGANYERQLWQPALQQAFPGFRGQRGELFDRFDRAREFRNRVTHHEPIHTTDLVKTLGNVFRLIGYISPDIASWANRRARIRHILQGQAGSSNYQRLF